MKPRIRARGLCCACALSLPALAAATEPTSEAAVFRSDQVPSLEQPKQVDDVIRGPVLNTSLAPPKINYWTVGVGIERFGTGFVGSDFLLALAVSFRHRAFGPHALLMAKPDAGSYEKSRFVLGFGLRGYFAAFGTDMSYGVGVHGEMRLEDHFWLLYATPIELGAVLYRKHSLDVQLFVGMRRAIAGELIDHFLLDPNGFHNEGAQAELDQLKTSDAWRGFVRLVFARRID